MENIYFDESVIMLYEWNITISHKESIQVINTDYAIYEL